MDLYCGGTDHRRLQLCWATAAQLRYQKEGATTTETFAIGEVRGTPNPACC
jgi:hypothetical protein